MLSRAGSNASSNNLRRSKSATSVKERRKHPLTSEPVDPETSRLHALIAAHKAMDRSHGSSSQSTLRFESKSIKRSNSQRTARSVHFSPGSEARTKLQSRRMHASSTTPASVTPESINRVAYTYEDSTISSEFGGAGENYGAQPSSYRRLGRAKSMLITSHQSRQAMSTVGSETPLSQAPTLRNAVSSMSFRQPGLRLRLQRSFNILRPTLRRATAPTSIHLEHTYHPDSVALARQQFLKGPSQPQVKKKISQLFQSRTRREQKAFRQTLRPDDSVVLDEVSPGLPMAPAQNKDSISSLLRSHFTKSFSKRGGSQDIFPAQQLNATRDHYGGPTTESGNEAGFNSYHEADVGLQRRNSLYVPSNPHPESCEDVESLSQKLRASASFESLRSNCKSRVTSWTNSTTASSTRGAVYESNRLSIIKEDGGAHQPSCSAGRHISGVSAFQQPMPNYGDGQIDSQRVYSALMKRIDQEQAEMERTQVSLAKIHEEEEEYKRISHQPFPSSTIRTVQSRVSSLLPGSSSSLDLSKTCQNLSQPLVENTAEEAKSHRLDADCSKRHGRQMEVRSTFFPFSKETKPPKQSPFKRSIQARQLQDEERSCWGAANDGSSVIVRRIGSNVGTNKWAQSSESIYSRNTDGCTNLDYTSPVGSTESFTPNPLQAYQDTGMATIMYSEYSGLGERRVPTAMSATPSEKNNWRSWVENQMANFSRHGSKASNHIRENARVESFELRDAQAALENDTVIPSGNSEKLHSIASQTFTSSAPMNGHWTPVEHDTLARDHVAYKAPSASSRPDHALQTHCEQILQVDCTDLSDINRAAQKHEIKGGALRKISPGNVVKMLRSRKSQPVLPSQSTIGKENKPGTGGVTTPVSTPGRLQLQMRSGNSTGRLRDRTNGPDLDESWNKISHVTDGATPINGSPSAGFKNSLSARLSRPFDMDVPESNRPFDSMYLGKTEPGFTETLKGDRLSIAPKAHQTRPHKTYGGLGLSPFADTFANQAIDDAEATALPVIPDSSDSVSRSSSLTGIAMHGKRMVSNFLKSRQKDNERNSEKLAPASSPAFL